MKTTQQTMAATLSPESDIPNNSILPLNGEVADLSLAPKTTRVDAWNMEMIPMATMMVALMFS